MKVLQIINSLGTGGAEKLLLDTLPKYRAAGIEMDVLLLWDNDFPFKKELEALGCCRIFILKKSSRMRDIYSLSHISKIRKLIRTYDILHVHLFPASYFVAVANVGIGKKMILTEHSISNKRMNNRLLKPLERWVYGKYDRLVSITEEVRELFHRYLKTGGKSVVIANGIVLEKIYTARPYKNKEIQSQLTEDDFLLLQVSSLRAAKDHDTLLKALSHLPEGAKLLLAGEGERKEELRSLAQKLGLTQRVFFLGARMDIPQLLKSVDVVILSSHYEGLSLSSIEGLASGKPFLASDVPGLREIVAGAGLLFPEEDDRVLAKLIDDLMKNPDKRRELGRTGMERAEKYSIENMVGKHIEVYQELFGQTSLK